MIDPVTLAVIRGRLEQIVDEMNAKLFRAAFSPVIAEADGGFEDGERAVWIGGGWQTTRIHDRRALPAGARVAGPAILEQSETTIFVDPSLGAESTNSAT